MTLQNHCGTVRYMLNMALNKDLKSDKPHKQVTAKKVPPQKKAKSTPAAGRGKGAEKRRRSNFI